MFFHRCPELPAGGPWGPVTDNNAVRAGRHRHFHHGLQVLSCITSSLANLFFWVSNLYYIHLLNNICFIFIFGEMMVHFLKSFDKYSVCGSAALLVILFAHYKSDVWLHIHCTATVAITIAMSHTNTCIASSHWQCSGFLDFQTNLVGKAESFNNCGFLFWTFKPSYSSILLYSQKIKVIKYPGILIFALEIFQYNPLIGFVHWVNLCLMDWCYYDYNNINESERCYSISRHAAKFQ